MGVIDYYRRLTPTFTVTQMPPLREPSKLAEGKPILSDAKDITLAEYDVDTKNAITAHHIKDYRRKRFSLMLLPKIDILFDRILEGSEYWNGLRNESTYS